MLDRAIRIICLARASTCSCTDVRIGLSHSSSKGRVAPGDSPRSHPRFLAPPEPSQAHTPEAAWINDRKLAQRLLNPLLSGFDLECLEGRSVPKFGRGNQYRIFPSSSYSIAFHCFGHSRSQIHSSSCRAASSRFLRFVPLLDRFPKATQTVSAVSRKTSLQNASSAGSACERSKFGHRTGSCKVGETRFSASATSWRAYIQNEARVRQLAESWAFIESTIECAPLKCL